MSQNVAPWLQGLDEAWEIPDGFKAPQNVPLASHDTDSMKHRSLSRIGRRSMSGQASIPTQKSSSQHSTSRPRNPLSPISRNGANTLRRENGTTKLSGTRSFSDASDGSVIQYGTVQQRAKSASPVKKQDTLEWKRRLVHGRVGYGDQTDLFGPTGLENIFAGSRQAEVSVPKVRKSMNWLDRSAVQSMPSSPPPRLKYADSEEQNINDEDTGHVSDGLMTVDEERESRLSRSMDSDCESPHLEPENFADSTQLDDQSYLPLETAKPAEVEESPPTSKEHEVIGNRTASGQTELEQEDFSPVFISKHTTINGQVDYKALDSHMIKRFQEMHVSLRHPSQRGAEEDLAGSGEHDDEQLESSVLPSGAQSDQAGPDLSLSEDLPTGTPPVATLTRNVELRRGGYSNYGSFKQRPLSPSQSATMPSAAYDQSSLLSPMPSSGYRLVPAPTPPQAPSTPVRPASHEQKSRSSGSPLKLFGPHDTFTNNRLLRRMSQLDPDVSAVRSGDEAETSAGRENVSRKITSSSFGSGEYDGRLFDAEITVTSASASDDNGSDRSPGSEVPPPGSKDPFGFRAEITHEAVNSYKIKRKASRQSAIASKASSVRIVRDLAQEDTAQTPPERTSVVDVETSTIVTSKRPPNSPYKAPESKRRRTLYAAEFQSQRSNTGLLDSDQPESALNSRKRKDARKGEDHNIAEPDVLAQRKLLRPRNPTPSQRRKQQIEAEIREATEQFAAQEPGKLEAVMEQLEESVMTSDSPPSIEQQAQAVANEVAKFTLRVQKASGEHTERKRSVTTQDFFNEAVMVMRLIREKAGRQSGLGSVAESDQEAIRSPYSDNSAIVNSALRVSRPPSREGGSAWRPRTSQQTDARKLSHLRRFQENDDTEFIAQSIASLGVSDLDEPQMVIVDEDSNIRITGPLTAELRLAHEDGDCRPNSQRSDPSTVNTQWTHKSNGTSTGRTIHTSSTRKSDNVGTLAPDAVAHLIGEQVGGMTFDKEKNQWVRVKDSPPKRPQTSFLEPSHISSDDDPFREISDLPTDELAEEKLRKASTGLPTMPLHKSPEPDQLPAGSQVTSQDTVIARPATGGSGKTHHTHSSSIPSQHTALYSSQQQHIETRATSWSHGELKKLSAQGKSHQQPLAYAAAQAALALAARNEGVELAQQQIQHIDMAAYLKRDRKITGDAPTLEGEILADEISGDEEDSSVVDLREDTAVGVDRSDVQDLASPKLRQTPHKATSQPASTYCQLKRQTSLRRQTLTNKLNTVAHREESEVSFIAALPGERMMSVSLSVSRPLSGRQQSGRLAELRSSPTKYDPSCILSDLPDFTIHEEDHERPSERALATRLANYAAAEVNDRYALATSHLVKTLTDVQEEDMYWDDLKQLDLHDRSLASLHGLNEFCGKVQEMDVSDNALTQLHGAPVTLRNLFARSNQLNSLTSWTQLMNLQYLDVSGNRIDSLHGLGCLVHLRELRADDNQIEDMSGITHLDGLLKLRLRRNKLRRVDFERSQLFRLQELDLCENDVESVEHLEYLQSLETLKLDGNASLRPLQLPRKMSALQHLSLQRCGLDQLDVSSLPHLRTLLLDNNRLSSVTAIETLKSLDLLSFRNQNLQEGAHFALLDRQIEARIIRLSGTHIPSLATPNSFLGVQTLALASCGLQTLPQDFGLNFPNLRILNLNFNSLKDIRPLLNIQKLEKLSVAGNRLDRLRKTVATLSKLPALKVLDMRDNPLALGFYAARTHSTATTTSVIRRQRNSKIDVDEDAAREAAEAARYSIPESDKEGDARHQDRLDEGTKLRRRVYQLLLANGCARLRDLDGLMFEKKDAMRRDDVWERLVELGVVRKSGQVLAE